MKKRIFVGTLVTLLCIPSYAYAKGSASVEFAGNRSVNVGDEFKVNMVLDNISETNGGIVGFGGYITYDKNVLELVNTNQANAGYEVMINENNNKIAALDFTLSKGIESRTTVYTITFKAIGEGNTNVTLTNGELVDKKENLEMSVRDLNVTSKNVVESTSIREDIPVEKIVKNEENTEVKNVNTVKKVEYYDTQEEVIEESIDNNENIVIENTIKNDKKVAKNVKKCKKTSNKFTKFFKKIFNKIFKKTTDK